MSSFAVTVKVTVFPSTTVWSGVTANVGACVSGASVGVTGSLLSDFTVPLLLVTTVSAVIGFPGRASVTLTVVVSPPLVFTVPIILLPSYKLTVEPFGTPLPTFTVISWPVKPFLLATLVLISGFLGLTINVAVVVFEELSL